MAIPALNRTRAPFFDSQHVDHARDVNKFVACNDLRKLLIGAVALFFTPFAENPAACFTIGSVEVINPDLVQKSLPLPF
jgi:hypothetical protein